MESIIQSNKVDLLTTRNLDMKLRRVVNASPSVDRNDYVIQNELTPIENRISNLEGIALPINNSSLSANATGALVLNPAGNFSIPGCTLVVPSLGTFLVTGMFTLFVDPLDAANFFAMSLYDAVGQVGTNLLYAPNGAAPALSIPFSMSWIYVPQLVGIFLTLTGTKTVVTAGVSQLTNGSITMTKIA